MKYIAVQSFNIKNLTFHFIARLYQINAQQKIAPITSS